jgi:hypothetical protein
MTHSRRHRLAGLTQILLVACLAAGAAPPTGLSAGPAQSIAINSDSARLWLTTPSIPS